MGRNTLGILLTGKEADGAQEPFNMCGAGAVTGAQDEKTSIVYGMPKVAVDIGAAEHVAALEDVPQTVIKALTQRRTRSTAVSSDPSSDDA